MASQDQRFDPARKFVRVTERRKDGFIAFDFSIGEPELYVEMILSAAAFEEFCRVNAVAFLEGEREPTEDEGQTWRLDQAQHYRLR